MAAQPVRGRYVLAGGVVGQPGAAGLLLAGGRIDRLLGPGEAAPPGAAVDDFRPHLLAPGTIDVHTHGGVGHDFSTASPEEALAVCRYLATTGATGVLPTVVGTWAELMVTLPRLGALSGNPAEGARGARVLGIHLEGPFLNPERRGAIDPATMRRPDVDDLRRLQDAAGGQIRMMTVAPELPGALAAIEEMTRLGIVPSIGHSVATYDEVLAAVRSGARKSTHTFNAMRPLAHRDPGTVGGVLAESGLVAELIPDGVHVHVGAMRVLVNAKGSAGTCLVTDAVRYAGLPDGSYEVPGGGALTVAGGAATMDDGTIAGSVTPIDAGLRLLRRGLGLEPEALFEMAAAVPARLLALHRKGRLEPGADADLAVYDSGLRPLATYVAGERQPPPAAT